MMTNFIVKYSTTPWLGNYPVIDNTGFHPALFIFYRSAVCVHLNISLYISSIKINS